MAGFLAVGIAILLAIVLCAGYALVLRELRQINANLDGSKNLDSSKNLVDRQHF